MQIALGGIFFFFLTRACSPSTVPATLPFGLYLIYAAAAAAVVAMAQREALVGALCNGEQWSDAVSEVERMLADSVPVDDITASLAVKAHAGMGLRAQWEEVGNRVARPIGWDGRGDRERAWGSSVGVESALDGCAAPGGVSPPPASFLPARW